MKKSNQNIRFITDSDASIDEWVRDNQIVKLDARYVIKWVWGFIPWPVLMYVGELKPLI